MRKNAVLYFCGDYSFECKKYESLLPPERFEKYNRIKPLREKQNCMGAYLLMRYALKEYGVSDYVISYSGNGKPYIAGGKAHFNLSHTACGFICAVDSDVIGADIESINMIKENTANRIFSGSETTLPASISTP